MIQNPDANLKKIKIRFRLDYFVSITFNDELEVFYDP